MKTSEGEAERGWGAVRRLGAGGQDDTTNKPGLVLVQTFGSRFGTVYFLQATLNKLSFGTDCL